MNKLNIMEEFIMKMKTRKGVPVEVAYFNVSDGGSSERMEKFEEVCKKYNLDVTHSDITPSATISSKYGDNKVIWNGEYLVAVAKDYFFVCHGNIVRHIFKDI